MKDIKNKNLHGGKLAGYDNFYLFDEKYDEVEKIVLESNKYSLSIFTDFDSAVIYTDNFDPNFEADNSKEKIWRCED